MTFHSFCFFVFSLIAAAAAIGVITLRHPVHAALSLVLTFFSTAAIWLLAEAEFLAITLVLVYVGAVMVLFLFVVMMLDVDKAPAREGFVKSAPVGMLVAVAMLVEMLLLIGVRTIGIELPPNPAVDAAGGSNVVWVARTLFRDYVLPFEVAALILTVGVIAAIPLTLRKRSGTKLQNPGRQVRVKPEDRIRLIKMDAVTKGDNKP